MRRPATPGARRALALYRSAPRGDRFHVHLRWWSCPFDAIERQVPPRGRVLDVGCGHGLLSLYLAIRAPQREVVGIDVDEHKIDLAVEAASRLGPREGNVQFATVAPEAPIDGTFDAIVIADVLYLLGVDARRDLLHRCVASLGPGGVLLVKETDRVPRWKSALTAAQERLATRAFKITVGETVDFAPPDELAGHLRDRGLRTRVARVDRGYLHPHVLVAGQVPATRAASS